MLATPDKRPGVPLFTASQHGTCLYLLLFKENTMKFTAQLFAATLALTAATGAFASETDGAADNAWLKQVAISQ